MTLSKQSILKHAGTLDRREVHVPAWVDESGDDVVLVRGMTIREWEIHQARLAREADDKAPKGQANARLLRACVIDETGAPLFDDGDLNPLANLSLGDVLKLQEAITEASGLGETAEDEARGESETAQTAGSSSE